MSIGVPTLNARPIIRLLLFFFQGKDGIRNGHVTGVQTCALPILSVASVDQIPYEEFIRSIPRMTILNLYSLEPLEGRIVMEVNPNIAFGLLDRLLGGKSNIVSKVDNLTEIETLLLSQLFEKATGSIQEAWSSIVEIDPYLEELEVNPQFLQMVSPNETVVVVSLNTEVGDASGMINICIPHIILEPIIPKLSVHYWMQSTEKDRDPDAYEKVTKNLQDVEVESKAVLGHSIITLDDLLHLKENDVIVLDQKTDESMVLEINDEPKFFVQPGKLRNKLSVQVLDEIKKRE